jgi:hypothetical protein
MRLASLYYIRALALACLALAVLPAPPVRAQGLAPTYTLTGPTGLMTVPDARMEPAGTVRLGISRLDPYWHATASAQLTDSLWVGVRQTSQAESIAGLWSMNPELDFNANTWAFSAQTDSLGYFPGMDIKWRLLREGRWRPAVALGLQNAVGHRRMAGEYLVASKRWRDLDFTLGVGWGRFAQAKLANNPMRVFSGHFGGPRSPGDFGSAYARAADWFTGEDIGLLGGVAWHTPIKGLVVKADTSGDRYEVEKSDPYFGFRDPLEDYLGLDLEHKDRDPWALGVEYTPPRAQWLSLAVGTQGGKVFAGRLTVRGNPGNWPLADDAPPPFAGTREDVRLRDIRLSAPEVSAAIDTTPWRSVPLQVGRAARHMALLARPDVKGFAVTPYAMNFRGPTLHLPRDGAARVAAGRMSGEELWHATTIAPPPEGKAPGVKDLKRWLKVPGPGTKGKRPPSYAFRMILDLEGSAGTFDEGLPYRVGLIAEVREARPGRPLVGGAALRLNIADNLSESLNWRAERLTVSDSLSAILLYPGQTKNPARGDIAAFTDNRVALETLYVGYTHTLAPGVYGAVTSGYLEEMYVGTGAEVLWRPYGARWALGADAWYLGKRDPYTTLAMGTVGSQARVGTGHVNLYYDVPRWSATLKLRAGRYLNGDVGGSVAVEKAFRNGAVVEAFATITDEQDTGPWGEKLGAYAGLRLRVPLGSLPRVPAGSEVRTTLAPLGRNNGQALRKPIDVYEITRPLALDAMAGQWDSVGK